jgi:hypothetical protein
VTSQRILGKRYLGRYLRMVLLEVEVCCSVIFKGFLSKAFSLFSLESVFLFILPSAITKPC